MQSQIIKANRSSMQTNINAKPNYQRKPIINSNQHQFKPKQMQTNHQCRHANHHQFISIINAKQPSVQTNITANPHQCEPTPMQTNHRCKPSINADRHQCKPTSNHQCKQPSMQTNMRSSHQHKPTWVRSAYDLKHTYSHGLESPTEGLSAVIVCWGFVPALVKPMKYTHVHNIVKTRQAV